MIWFTGAMWSTARTATRLIDLLIASRMVTIPPTLPSAFEGVHLFPSGIMMVTGWLRISNVGAMPLSTATV